MRLCRPVSLAAVLSAGGACFLNLQLTVDAEGERVNQRLASRAPTF
jgi:hypothetical protein